MDERDLFISHSSEDAEPARALRAELEGAGYTCWMAPDDVVGTDSWAEQILAAIDACRAMIVLVSANANRSPHVSREVNLALARRRPVLPIRIENVAPDGSLEYLLSLVQRVDAFPPPITGHGDRVLRRLSAVLRPNATPPPPPDAATGSPGQPVGATPRALGPGSVVDDFTIEALLNEGGMGQVFRAQQAEPRRLVALKVIRPEYAADAGYRNRFLAEKDALAALEHPAIVPIYGAGEDDGVLYIAMRLVDGTNLQGRISADGPLTLDETVELLRPIADAIDYAHDAGVVHRDLKPSNIILDRQGRAYLTDFGLTKRVDSEKGLTQAGVALGTFEYMAPEQVTGRGDPALTGRIDIYALGCLVYTCLTGRPPFVRESPEQLLYAHANELPAGPRSLRSDLADGTDAAVLRALAKAPEDRYARATEFIRELAAVAGHRDAPSSRATRPAPVAAPASIGAPAPPSMPPASTLHLSTPGPAQGGPAGLAGWLAGRQALVGGLVVLAVVAIGVLAAVRVFSPPSATASPGASQGGADPTAASTQSIDIAAPTGGALRLVPTAGLTPPAGAALATSLDIVVEIADHPTDGSGVASYLVSNAPSRPPLADAQAYRASFPWRLGQADGLAGPRTVYVWFGDTLGNWMVEPVFATIDFDNPPVPVANQVYDLTAGELCANYGVQHDMNLTLLPYLATDVDGNDGLRVLRVWTGNEQFEGGLDLSGGLSADGASVSITFNLTSPARQRFTDYFTVSDAAGATADGSFGIDVGECP